MRPFAIPALPAAAIVLVALLARGGGEDRTLRAAFDEAVQVVPGQEVRIAGRKVGSVGDVSELDGDAIVELHIDDDDWPLHRGTVARLRYGSVSGYAGRFVDLRPGPSSAPRLGDGAVLSTASTVTPVEFDQIFNTFDAPARRDLQGVLDEAADTVDGRGKEIASAVRDGGRGLDDYAGFAHDLADNPAALRTLVRAGARTTAALRSHETALKALLRRAAGTVEELASRANAQRQTLARLPGTLRTSRATLGRLDDSLAGVRALVGDLAPGARGLAAVAPSLRRTTTTLRDVAPRATATLEAGRRNAPAIDRLLRSGTRFLPRLGSVLGDSAPMLACIRPYAPELVGTATTWVGFSGSDEDGGYGRVDLTQLPPLVAAGSAASSKQVTDVYKDRVHYAMPRPPGLDAGQPWFLPECGAGRDALDPGKDPERR